MEKKYILCAGLYCSGKTLLLSSLLNEASLGAYIGTMSVEVKHFGDYGIVEISGANYFRKLSLILAKSLSTRDLAFVLFVIDITEIDQLSNAIRYLDRILYQLQADKKDKVHPEVIILLHKQDLASKITKPILKQHVLSEMKARDMMLKYSNKFTFLKTSIFDKAGMDKLRSKIKKTNDH